MNQVKTELLLKKYPKIFPNGFYFECGDGWYDLIDELCDAIQTHCDSTPEAWQVVAQQVKEKFGGLRFYYTGGDEFVEGVVAMAEAYSYHVCEQCGDLGTKSKTGWITVRCPKCSRIELEAH